MISLYWDIGRLIVERQRDGGWGRSVVETLAGDLQAEFPSIKGFSAANLWRTRPFYDTYARNEKLAPSVREIGWCFKNQTIVEYALRESPRSSQCRLLKVVSALPEELRRQLPVPDQVSKMPEDL